MTPDKYTIHSKPIGKGGSAESFIAEEKAIGRKVMVRMFSPSYSQDPDIRERFIREARALFALSSLYILRPLDIGEHEGSLFIVSEFVDGKTLSEKIKSGPIVLTEAIDIATQIALGLEEAHSHGIIHRDIKPDNIIITNSGTVKIMDFGIAKSRAVESLTSPETPIGTLRYMSPEQVSGARIDHRSDIYSFGVLFYEMLSGVNPFARKSLTETLEFILHREPPSLIKYRPDIPKELEIITNRALEKDAKNRYQSIHQLLDDLKAVRKELHDQRARSQLRAENIASKNQLNNNEESKTNAAERLFSLFSLPKSKPASYFVLLLESLVVLFGFITSLDHLVRFLIK